MIGRLLWRPKAATVEVGPVEARLDALEAALSVKLQALLVTATQAIAETVRTELARERRVAAVVRESRQLRSGQPPTLSLLDAERNAAGRTLRERLGRPAVAAAPAARGTAS